MKKILALIILCSCSEDELLVNPPRSEEYTLCTDVRGVCVVEESFSSMDIDYTFLSWVVETIEYETDFYYPGLDLVDLAQQHNLILLYKWANSSTQHQGTYSDVEVMARVYLRKGDAITPRMECSDRYYIAAHEILHFIAERYLFATYENNDFHYVPFMFRHWALLENLPVDYTIEGRLYTMIWRHCDSIN